MKNPHMGANIFGNNYFLDALRTCKKMQKSLISKEEKSTMKEHTVRKLTSMKDRFPPGAGAGVAASVAFVEAETWTLALVLSNVHK